MRETWMDALRGIAMLLVVLLHAGLALEYYATGYPRSIEVFNQAFQPYRMPTLIFLSGVLLSRSLSKSAGTYFGGKARKIVWPYAVWTVIALTLQGDLGLHELGRAVYDPVETHLWYLWFLIIFYSVAWLMKLARVPALPVAIIALIASGFLPENPMRLEKMFFLFGFFLLGHVFALHRESVSAFLRRPVAVAFAVVAVLVASAMNIAGFKVLYEPIYALCVVGAISLAMILVPRIPAGRVRGALEYVGRNSIILYVVHLLVIKVSGTVMQRIGIDNPWLMFPALVALGIGVSVVLMYLAGRFRVPAWLFEWNPPARARANMSSATTAA